MAATRLIALHKNRGKSVAACLKSRTDYAKNPDKTNKGELVSSYECSPLTADEEFMLSSFSMTFCASESVNPNTSVILGRCSACDLWCV